MKGRGLLVLLACCVLWSAAWADPAVLIKAYSAEVIRGHYWLGKRVVRMGETVRVQRVEGPMAYVQTEDGDPLTVFLTDLRAIPEKPAPAPPVAPTPTATPALATAEPPISILRLLSPPTKGKIKAEKVAVDAAPGARREVAIQCSATTKKGTPCTRMTKSPNGLCWQHGGD